MRTAKELVEAIAAYGDGFSLKIDEYVIDDDKIVKFTLNWDSEHEKRSTVCDSKDKTIEEQCKSILDTLKYTRACVKNSYKDCWLPTFTSLEELDLKLSLMNI